jgi:hypothetical protein
MPTRLFQKGEVHNPKGAPRKTLAKQDLAAITKLAAKGVRERDIARAVGVSNQVWDRQKVEQPEVQAAFHAGRQVMHDALVGKLFERAMKGDIVPNLFLLKTVFGYREGDEPQEVRPQITINMQGTLSPEAYRERIAARHVIEHETPPALPAPKKGVTRG